MKRATWVTMGLACLWFSWTTGLAGQGTSAADTSKPKVGVYDSRVLAYAHFWTDAHQQRLNAMVKSAQEAKAAGQTERFKEFDAALKKEQEQNHLQVFSTAPVDNVLAEMKDRVATVQKEAGVSQLVSKWDDKTLKAFPRDQQVDVTDLLLREFKLNEKQAKDVEEMRKQKPLPLDEAQKLLREGKL